MAVNSARLCKHTDRASCPLQRCERQSESVRSWKKGNLERSPRFRPLDVRLKSQPRPPFGDARGTGGCMRGGAGPSQDARGGQAQDRSAPLRRPQLIKGANARPPAWLLTIPALTIPPRPFATYRVVSVFLTSSALLLAPLRPDVRIWYGCFPSFSRTPPSQRPSPSNDERLALGTKTWLQR